MARDIYEDQEEVQTQRDGLSHALIFMTFLLLVGAIFFMQKALGDHYNAGMFAEKGAPAE